MGLYYSYCSKCNNDGSFSRVDRECGKCSGTGKDWREESELEWFRNNVKGKGVGGSDLEVFYEANPPKTNLFGDYVFDSLTVSQLNNKALNTLTDAASTEDKKNSSGGGWAIVIVIIIALIAFGNKEKKDTTEPIQSAPESHKMAVEYTTVEKWFSRNSKAMSSFNLSPNLGVNEREENSDTQKTIDDGIPHFYHHLDMSFLKHIPSKLIVDGDVTLQGIQPEVMHEIDNWVINGNLDIRGVCSIPDMNALETGKIKITGLLIVSGEDIVEKFNDIDFKAARWIASGTPYPFQGNVSHVTEKENNEGWSVTTGTHQEAYLK